MLTYILIHLASILIVLTTHVILRKKGFANHLPNIKSVYYTYSAVVVVLAPVLALCVILTIIKHLIKAAQIKLT